MDRRTYESPMDWQYNEPAPCDPSSPFTHAAQGKSALCGFGTPLKESGRPNIFSSLPSPSNHQSSQTPHFARQISAKNTAPPFRNPAFTTPRQPVDESLISEASGAEDSPVASDVPNDTPEVDHIGDVSIGVLTPSRVSKSLRYGGFTHKHSSGKGEIRSNRDPPRFTSARKRKRPNLDRDVGKVVQYLTQDESEGEIDNSALLQGRRKKKDQGIWQKRGIVGHLFHMLDEHPNAPENLHRWIQLFINMMVATTVIGIGWSVVSTIRSDIRTANDGARLEIMSRIADCQNHYTANSCEANDRPALRAQCDQWYDCMMQNPESIMRVKVTAKQIAEIINEFSEAMNFKAWGFFFAVIIICVFGNNLVLGRNASPTSQNALYKPQASKSSVKSVGEEANVVWMPVHTPRIKRQAILDDGSDTDSPFPRSTPLMLPEYTPSGRWNTNKGERARSPMKLSTPSKGF